MILSEILLTALVSSLACVGLFAALDEGAVLHFIQRPFIKHRKRVESWQKQQNAKVPITAKKLGTSPKVLYAEIERSAKYQLSYQWFFKPLVLCGRCFASVWGTTTFYVIHGITHDNWQFAILNIFCTACLNILILRYYD